MVQPQQQLANVGTFRPIRCVECGRAADGPATGWKAFVSGGYEGEPVEIVVYCPPCGLREVGGPAD